MNLTHKPFYQNKLTTLRVLLTYCSSNILVFYFNTQIIIYTKNRDEPFRHSKTFYQIQLLLSHVITTMASS